MITRVKKLGYLLWFWIAITLSLFHTPKVLSQLVPDNSLGNENSVVNPIDLLNDIIDGGATRDTNLFHSFQEFNVGEGRGVYFANPTAIENILTRVTGGNPSDILGKLGVLGEANLFLINPNGIYFGEQASLDIRGSFTATTADSIRLGENGLFSASDPESSTLLSVQPGALFTNALRNYQASINNEGNLTISEGGNLTLSGDTIVSTGQLSTPTGHLQLEAVAGDGRVIDLTAKSATLLARDNLILESSQLRTTEDLTLLAQDTVYIRDSLTNPFLALVGGNLTIQGNQAIDILALNHPQTPFQSRGDMTLVSDGNISGDAHFASGGNFSLLNLAGEPGIFVSLNDPIISANGNVTFGSYTGVSLKVEATGTINIIGDITIIAPDTTLIPTGEIRGDTTIVTADDGTLTEAIITNSNGSVSSEELDTFLGENLSDISTEGSAFKTTFSAQAGDTLVFEWNFSTNESIQVSNTFNDFAFAVLSGANEINGTVSDLGGDITNGLNLLADTEFSEFTSPGEQFTQETGFQTFTVTLANAGDYSLGVGVVDVADSEVDSGVILQNGRLVRGNLDIPLTVSAPDVAILNSSSALILRAGVTNLSNSPTAFPLIAGDLPTEFTENLPPNLPGTITVDGNISTVAGGGGPVIISAPGDINITGTIDSSSSSALIPEANGGSINLDSSEGSINLNLNPNFSCGGICTNSNGGNSGDVLITANQSILINSGQINSTSSGDGRAGDVLIRAGAFNSQPLAIELIDTGIDAAAFGSNGRTGNITLEAINEGAIALLGQNFTPIIFSDTFASDDRSVRVQTGGDITITGGNLTLNNYALVADISPDSLGDGGSISVNGDRVLIQNSSISTATFGSGKGGNITLTGELVELTEGTVLNASTAGINDGGSISIAGSTSVNLSNNSNLSTTVQVGATGEGGSITLTGELVELTEGTVLDASTAGINDGGSISIETPNNGSFLLDGSNISTTTLNSGQAGEINITAGSITLNNNAFISAGVSPEFSDNNLDTELFLFDSFGNLLAANDDSDALLDGAEGSISNLDSFINFTFEQDDTYILGVGAFESFSSGNEIEGNTIRSGEYTLQISLVNHQVSDPSNLNVNEIEPNNSLLTAQNLDGNFTLGFNPNIESSDSIPYVSVLGTGDGTFDYYSFEATTGSQGIFDIDTGINNGGGEAGNIILEATGEINITDSEIDNRVEGLSPTSQQAEILINGAAINLTNTNINSSTTGTGDAGNILLQTIDTGEVNITNSQISTTSQPGATGNAGKVEIRTGELLIQGESQISTATFEQGRGGDITLDTTDLVQINNSFLEAETQGTREAGIITINTQQLSLQDGAIISTSTQDEGRAGNVTINATETIELINSNIITAAQLNSRGNSGSVDITTNSLSVIEGARIQAQTSGLGAAGNIFITASESINIAGVSPFGLNSGLLTSSENATSGDGGSIFINSLDNPQGTLHLSEQGFLSARTRSSNNSGLIEVNVNNLILETGGQIVTTATTTSSGEAGVITVNGTDSIRIEGIGTPFEPSDNLIDTPFAGVTVFDLNSLTFNTIFNPNVEASGEGGIPYISISRLPTEIRNELNVLGSADNTFDYYSFSITEANSRGIFDIDNEIFDIAQAGSIDTELFLFNFNTGELLAQNDDSDITQGAEGSLNSLDSLIDFNFTTPGTYVIGVGEFDSIAASGTLINGESPDIGDSYTLQISLENQGNLGEINFDDFNPNQGLASGIFANTQGSGNAGLVRLNSPLINLNEGAEISSSTSGIGGNAGGVELTSTQLISLDASLVSSAVEIGAEGNGGGINIETGSLSVTNGARLSTNTAGIGDAGTITIIAQDNITFAGINNQGQGILGGVFSSVEPTGEGTSLGISIDTGSLLVTNGAIISSSTLGIGEAGRIDISAQDTIIFEGVNPEGIFPVILPGIDIQGVPSTIISLLAPNAQGRGGDINIETDSILVRNGAILSSSTFGLGDAGNITINARDQIEITNLAQVTAATDSFAQGNAGKLDLSAINSIEIENSSVFVTVESQSIGNAGSVFLNAATVSLEDNGRVSSSSAGLGNAGEVDIIAVREITINNSEASSAIIVRGVGDAGSVNLDSPAIFVSNGSTLSSSTAGIGNAGAVNLTSEEQIILNHSNITSNVISGAIGNAGGVFINTDLLNLTQGTEISSATTGIGAAGNVIINAQKQIVLDASRVSSAVEFGAVGNGGNLDFTTKELSLTNEAEVSASTSGQGNGGRITILATDEVFLDNSQISAAINEGAGTLERVVGGEIEIITDTIILTNGAQIIASTVAEGNAERIFIQGKNLSLNQGSQLLTTTASEFDAGDIVLEIDDSILLSDLGTGLFASTEELSGGGGGNIIIDPISVIIKDGAGIAVNSLGTGEGGVIELQADSLTLDNEAFITAATTSNQGGEITLQVQDLILIRRNSQITATAGTEGAGGDGGNININAQFIVGVPSENSDITANAFEGKGGNINITTSGIFGLDFRPELTLLSDITASSEFGVAGNVEINNPDVDPTSGLIELPANLVDAESLVSHNVCAFEDEKIAGGSSLVITGRGGLPPNPNEPLSSTTAIVEWAQRSVETELQEEKEIARLPVIIQNREQKRRAIQQAQGWVISADGQIILTEEVSTVTLQNSPLNHPDCSGKSSLN